MFYLSQIVNLALFQDQRRLIIILFLSQLTLEVITKLYSSAVNHPEGRNREGASHQRSFRQTHLKMSCRGLIRRVFQHLQHVNCSRGQSDFPSPEVLIHHIERSHPKDKDSVTFCTRTTLDRSTSRDSSGPLRIFSAHSNKSMLFLGWEMAELGDLWKTLVSQGMLVSYGARKFSFEKRKRQPSFWCIFKRYPMLHALPIHIGRFQSTYLVILLMFEVF